MLRRYLSRRSPPASTFVSKQEARGGNIVHQAMLSSPLCYFPRTKVNSLSSNSDSSYPGTSKHLNSLLSFRHHCVILPQQWAAFHTTAGEGGDVDDFQFDPTASIVQDAKKSEFTSKIHEFISKAFPAMPSSAQFQALGKTSTDWEEALRKVSAYLETFPINELISERNTIVITHVENEAGEDQKAKKVAPISFSEAMRQAKEGYQVSSSQSHSYDLVQLASKQTISYCRLRRNETAKMQKKFFAELTVESNKEEEDGDNAKNEVGGGKQEAAQQDDIENQKRDQLRKRFQNEPPEDCIFKDVVDDHFIEWKSKKMVRFLNAGIQVKLRIQQFTGAESAVRRMKDMLAAIKTEAKAKKVWHSCQEVVVTDKELLCRLVPSRKQNVTQIKHPSDKEWQHYTDKFLRFRNEVGKAGTFTARPYLTKPTSTIVGTPRKEG